MTGRQRIGSAAEAVADERIQAFGVILTTTSLLERLLGTAMERDSGLSHPMFEVLLLVGATPGGVPMGELSRRLVLTSGGATRLVDRMVEAGLVARERSRGDKRVQMVTLTPVGEAKLVEAAQRHADQLDRHVFGVLAPERLAAVVSGLDELGGHVSDALPPLG
ncbi:MarR family winged helix-turn-helix transcriptional regulator [Streptacidiphilus sp. P02-A3a]|uniref:MarR family winged helix-turn-helix transcriptional regulator n=1 Tax=Streptacidiphilus sp. P02-A3a TaxID=2704468 RepID=UPI0015FB6547|nr:MarR family winged helix-turn-helix transcriptional regulator [Streptacidiphilus sp. P02-A3a]QMU71955.1 winged helix-turn-helix transcriptional regulator [Streptacidiphilus sp. P02-A3a]